jgi:hypothetical protein
MTTRILVLAVALCLCSVVAVYADENVREVQTKLYDGGFYSGEIDGAYSSALSAALTRYQIRNGLPVTGQLDIDTSKSLGATPAVTTNAKDPDQDSETWRQLRKSRQQSSVKSPGERTASSGATTENRSDATSGQSRSTAATGGSSGASRDRSETTSTQSSPPVRAAANAESETIAETQAVGSPPPANADTTRVASEVPSSSAPKVGSPPAADTSNIRVSIQGGNNSSAPNVSADRLRDYVAAFVLAGLDPHVGSEVDFFANRVRYYDDGIKDRDAIRKDLQSYNARWPHRTFWLPGDIKVEPQSDNRLRVTFPLKFELTNGSKHSSGQVEKSLVLETAGDDFQIVAVSERKAD